jgi:hypothetical protein
VPKTIAVEGFVHHILPDAFGRFDPFNRVINRENWNGSFNGIREGIQDTVMNFGGHQGSGRVMDEDPIHPRGSKRFQPETNGITPGLPSRSDVIGGPEIAPRKVFSNRLGVVGWTHDGSGSHLGHPIQGMAQNTPTGEFGKLFPNRPLEPGTSSGGQQNEGIDHKKYLKKGDL